MVINARLNSKDISDAIRQVESFKIELQRRLVLFVSELADVGIEVAKDNTYVEVDDVYENMGDRILFKKETEVSDLGAVCILVATGQDFIKEWQNGKAMVNPLLMAEFGSGWRAIDGHQGTFPHQHVAFMRPWHWVDSNGTPHESYGSEPSRPLFKAKQEMEKQIQSVVERVFGV